ncbi:MAG: hypothetical protein GY796_02035 [Chloroflexi bacterium]|nr:hypothetical protein [Chloroflexota bacterium]
MNFVTKTSHTQIFVWLIWFIALLAFAQPAADNITTPGTTPLLGIVSHNPQDGPLFPWRPRYRRKQRALRQYKAWKHACRQAKWAARQTRLAMKGATTLAQLVDLLTRRQMHYQIGALPVLYALLESLQVRHIINRHCSG